MLQLRACLNSNISGVEFLVPISREGREGIIPRCAYVGVRGLAAILVGI